MKMTPSKGSVRYSVVTKPSVQVGRRLTQVTILSGSVVRVWGTLESILERNEHSLSKSDRTMRVVRVELEAGRHLVGTPPVCLMSSTCLA